MIILQQQRPAESALYRSRFPEDYDRDKLVQRVEMLAVLIVRGQMLQGKQSDVAEKDLPVAWDDIFSEPEPEPELLTMSEIDRRIWGQAQEHEHAIPAELLTPEEIDQRMGW